MATNTGYWYRGQTINSLLDYVEVISQIQEQLDEVLFEDFTSKEFINWLEEKGYQDEYNDWYKFYYGTLGIRKDEDLVGHILEFLGKVCPQGRKKVISTYISYIKSLPEFWIKEHIDDYEMNESMENILATPLDNIVCLPEMSFSELMKNHKRIRDFARELRREFMNNAWLYQMNLYEVSESRITSSKTDTYFVAHEKYQSVPVGWLKAHESSAAPELLNRSAVRMREEAVEAFVKLKQQVADWQKNMRMEKKTKEDKKNLPNAVIVFSGLAASGILLLCCLVGMFRVGSWENAWLLQVVYVAAIILGGLCLIQFIRQFMQYKNWQNMQSSYRKIAMFSSDLDKKIQQLNQLVTFENNMLIKNKVLEQKTENAIIEMRVEQATFKQLAQNKKVFKNSNGYLVMILAVAVLSMGMTTAVYKMQSPSPSVSDNKEKETSETKKANKEVVYTVSVSKANVRTGPGTSYSVYDTYKKGTKLKGTGTSKSDGSRLWYEITLDNETIAWICETTVD